MDIEEEPLQETDITQPTPAKQKISKQISKIIKKSHTLAKGNLEDILHSIDIEESPIVQAEDIEDNGRKLNKGKTVKKLDFVGEDDGFIFQLRKPMTRHVNKVMESKKTEKINEASQSISIIDLSPSAKEEVVIKKRNGKEKTIEKLETETLKEKLKEAGKEISVLKL